ncbi:hypothetical protein ABZ136_10915, partial [Streptomyces microflavus]|uniref:hypothetical protein n=1 Tax=Streptomyces microflavus TaxID=1919 RepID=UPI003476BBBB
MTGVRGPRAALAVPPRTPPTPLPARAPRTSRSHRLTLVLAAAAAGLVQEADGPDDLVPVLRVQFHDP